MKICPLGNTQEMFKPQIRSYPLKNLCGNFSYSKVKSDNERGKSNTGNFCTILQLHHFAVIPMSQGHISTYQYGILEIDKGFV